MRTVVQALTAFCLANLQDAALVKQKFALRPWQMFMACWDRELLLVYRNLFLYGFRTFQSVLLAVFTALTYPKPRMPARTQDDGNRFFSVLFFSMMICMFDGITELNLTVRASCRWHLRSPAGSGQSC